MTFIRELFLWMCVVAFAVGGAMSVALSLSAAFSEFAAVECGCSFTVPSTPAVSGNLQIDGR